MVVGEDFRALMEESYDAQQADELINALENTEPEVSIRLNPHKTTLEEKSSLLSQYSPVPWCDGAFYLNERPPFTFDPLLHAGVYYVQEASSMYLHEIISKYSTPSTPHTVLDLCASPGGKSTLLAGMLAEGSTLVSNEPINKRAQVLAENITKWTRMPNGKYPVRCVVTNNYPVDFARFTECFDVVVTDVPCSGEGMFRKDEVAQKEWSLEKVHECQNLQREILETIYHALKPGGLLVYSTCTFNHLEDEDNVAWLTEHLNVECLEQRHFLPGRDRGEGFFIAALRKSGEVEQKQEVLPLKTLRVLYDSDTAEEWTLPKVELSYQEALQYLRHEAVRVDAPRGMVTLTYKGHVLGTGKGVGNRINNLYPQEWRIRTTYNKEFRLL